MSELQLYEAEFDIDDDPASFGGSVLLMASSPKEAREIARKSAIERYNDQAGGWSLKPRITHMTCHRYTLPTKSGVVFAAGTYQR